MQARPIAISHQLVVTASTNPATQAIPKQTNAARFTSAAGAAPAPTNRIGPTRSASVPRTPSE